MNLKIYYNHWYPRLLHIRGIVYYPFVLIAISRGEAIKERILHHEWIHVQQIRRDGLLYFYLRWNVEFLLRFLKYFHYRRAYREISYEREAYEQMWKVSLPETLI